LIVAIIGSAAPSRSRQPPHGDPAAALNVETPVPAGVMSTLRRACFDCHSYETRWPWYAALPVASWLLERDVEEARGQLNFSLWAQYDPYDRADMLDKVCDLAASRDMPLWQYRLLHSRARLSDIDIAELCAWSRGESARLTQGGS
jgi:hypothetical protein